MSGREFVALDGLRGVAAVAVAVGHLRPVLDVNLRVNNTALAVDFFFILSGFVLVHAYGERLQSGGKLTDFLVARCVRLYPLVLLGTALGLVANLAAGGREFPILLYSVLGGLLLPLVGQNSIDPSFFPLNPPSWSLFFELVASVAFGVGLWRGRMRTLIVTVFMAAILLVAAVRHEGSFDMGWSSEALPLGMTRVAFGMGLGVLLYRLHQRGVGVRSVHPGLLAVLLLIILLGPFAHPLVQVATVFLLFPPIVLSAASRKPVWAAANNWSGRLSYPIYALHWPVYLLVDAVRDRLAPAADNAWVGPLALILAIGTAAAALLLYDEPVRRSLMRHWRHRAKLVTTNHG